MKTSFYFVVWICIYPILESFGIDFINEHSFMFALAAVWGLSAFIKQLIPQTLDYEEALKNLPLLEHAYNGNVAAIRKRITTEYIVSIVSAIYFVVTTLTIAFFTFAFGQSDWLALIIFGIFSYLTIRLAIGVHKAKSTLLANPTPEQCRELVSETYKLSYEAYESERASGSFEDMFPERPDHYTAFRVFSIIVAVIASLLGLWFILESLLAYLFYGAMSIPFAVMPLLYGSLAAYYGIRDIIETIQYKDILKGK